MMKHMMLPLLGVVLLSSLSVGEDTQPPPSYVAMMPKVMRPGMTYDVSVSILEASSSVTVETAIKDKDKNILETKTMTLNAGETGVAHLDAPVDLSDSTVNVTITMTGGITKTNETEVSVKLKTLSIFIQTDKAMYKPGDKVKYRAVTVHPDLMPYYGPMNLSIHDSKGNRVAQWMNVPNPKGFVSKELQLSTEPVLGNWKVKVTANKVVQEKEFEIAEYVLPKYEVTIDLPPYMHKDIKRLIGSVTAKYTFGKPVDGIANIRIELKRYAWEMSSRYINKYPVITLTKQLVLGKADFTVEDLAVLAPNETNRYYSDSYKRDPWNSLNNREILVAATVTETLTGKVLAKNATVNVASNKYKMKFLDITPDTFKPGLLYNAYLQLTTADDMPPRPQDLVFPNGTTPHVAVTLSLNYKYRSGHTYRQALTSTMNYTFDSAGLVRIRIDVQMPPGDDEYQNMNLNANFRNTYAYKSASKFESRDDKGIQVSMPGSNGTVKAGTEVIFQVRTTDEIRSFYYEIMSKGMFSIAQQYTSSIGSLKQHNLTLDLNADRARDLAPSARIVVWYLTPLGEVVTDSLDFNVDGAFANNVSLEFNKEIVKPAEELSLTVKAYKGSIVGLLAVDQSVLLLKGGNDITKDMVTEELGTYDANGKNDHDGIYPMMRGRRKRSVCCWWPMSYGGKDSYEIFDNAGVIVLTDAYVHREVPDHTDYRYAFGPEMEFDDREDAMAGVPGARAPAGAAPDASDGAGANNGPPGSVSKTETLQEVKRTRSEFPETWIWTEETVGENGEVSLNVKAPDTITSWVASAFALSGEKGLGIGLETNKVTVFKPFFVSLTLPYSIIRGEEFSLMATVFNYLQSDLTVVVTLKRSDLFQVKDPGANGGAAQNAEIQTTVTVPAGDGKTVGFWIVPKMLGNVPIEVTAQSNAAADGLKRNLLVEAEGAPESYSIAKFIDLSSGDSKKYVDIFNVDLPTEDLVPGSENIVVTAIGDILGPSINGLDKLLKMPYGCGEQNMLNFAPNIFVMKYLEETNQVTTEIQEKAVRFMESGYQRENNYQRTDGSYSAFGNSDPSGSTWLTAFVVKSFVQAKPYIDIDDDIIERAVQFILKQQAPDGTFAEPGRVIHKDMQGGSSKGVAMTAYVLVTLMELEKVEDAALRASVAKAAQLTRGYLESQITATSSDPYGMAIVTYALAASKSTHAADALNKLNALSTDKDGQQYWSNKKKDAPEPVDDGIWRPRYVAAASSQIEMAAYALLTHSFNTDITGGLPVAKWLVSQRNKLGGYGSTQDTVMALQALSEYAALAGKPDNLDMALSIDADGMVHQFTRIQPLNSLLLQSVEIPATTKKIEVTGSGKGIAIVQMAVDYNIFNVTNKPGINLDVRARKDDKGRVIVSSCAWYVPAEGDTDPSGMVIMQVNALSGFVATNQEELKKTVKGLKRVESEDEKTTILYFDEFKQERTCVELETEPQIEVTNLQKARVKAYSYYNADEMTATEFYLPGETNDGSMCDACPTCCNDPNLRIIEETPEAETSPKPGMKPEPSPEPEWTPPKEEKVTGVPETKWREKWIEEYIGGATTPAAGLTVMLVALVTLAIRRVLG